METSRSELNLQVVRLLSLAVSTSGQSTAQIAQRAGLKWDTVRRTLNGKRSATVLEIVAILEAAGFQADETIRLMLLVDGEFAASRARSDVGRFLNELLSRSPREIIAQLGEDIQELRPRWANGTAKLLARTLQQHVSELNRRGDSIEEQFLSRVGFTHGK